MANLITTQTINDCGSCITSSDACFPIVTTNRGSEMINITITTNQSRLVSFDNIMTSATGQFTIPPTFHGYAGQLINITATVGANIPVYFLCGNGEYYNEIRLTLLQINSL